MLSVCLSVNLRGEVSVVCVSVCALYVCTSLKKAGF